MPSHQFTTVKNTLRNMHRCLEPNYSACISSPPVRQRDRKTSQLSLALQHWLICAVCNTDLMNLTDRVLYCIGIVRKSCFEDELKKWDIYLGNLNDLIVRVSNGAKEFRGSNQEVLSMVEPRSSISREQELSQLRASLPELISRDAPCRASESPDQRKKRLKIRKADLIDRTYNGFHDLLTSGYIALSSAINFRSKEMPPAKVIRRMKRTRRFLEKALGYWHGSFTKGSKDPF